MLFFSPVDVVKPTGDKKSIVILLALHCILVKNYYEYKLPRKYEKSFNF